jgi:hypothetical protein
MSRIFAASRSRAPSRALGFGAGADKAKKPLLV